MKAVNYKFLPTGEGNAYEDGSGQLAIVLSRNGVLELIRTLCSVLKDLAVDQDVHIDLAGTLVPVEDTPATEAP